jgi:hypothetical protein
MTRTGRAGEDDRLVGELVVSPQRRDVVGFLRDNGGVATFDEVVDVLDREADRHLSAVRLHHVHLPKLQAAGAVEWDEETGEIRLTPRARATVTNDIIGRLAGD